MPFLPEAGYYLVPYVSSFFRGKQESCGAARYGSADKGGNVCQCFHCTVGFRFRYVFHLVLDLVNELIELVFLRVMPFSLRSLTIFFASILTFFRSYEKSDGRTGDSAAPRTERITCNGFISLFI